MTPISAASRQSANAFVEAMTDLRLLRWLRDQGPAIRLLVSADLLEPIRHKMRARRSLIQNVEEAEDFDPGVRHLLILDSANARYNCKRLRARHPDLQVDDVIMDIVPRLMVDAAGLAPMAADDAPTMDIGALQAVFYAAPGSEVEAMTATLSHAGLGRALVVLPIIVRRWAQHSPQFSLLRFLAMVLATVSDDAPWNAVIYTNHAMEVLDARGQSLAPWARRVRAASIKLIGYQMRDRLVQSVLAHQYQGRAYGSVLAMDAKALGNLKERPYSFLPVLKQLTDVVASYTLFSRRFSNYDRLLVLTHEDFQREPVSVLETICDFLGLQPGQNPDAPDFSLIYQKFPALEDQALRFGWDMIDELGLHANDQGTLLPLSQQIFQRDAGRSPLRKPDD